MKIKIKNKFISEQDKPFLIAEISANHKNSINKTYKLLAEAKKIGVDAVKFQTFDLDEMTLNLKKNEFLIKKNLKPNCGTTELFTVFIKKLSFLSLGIRKYLTEQKNQD